MPLGDSTERSKRNTQKIILTIFLVDSMKKLKLVEEDFAFCNAQGTTSRCIFNRIIYCLILIRKRFFDAACLILPQALVYWNIIGEKFQ